MPVTNDQIMQVLDSSNYYEQESYATAYAVKIDSEKRILTMPKSPTFVMAAPSGSQLLQYYNKQIEDQYQYLIAVINNRKNLLQQTHPETAPTFFLMQSYNPFTYLNAYLQNTEFQNFLQWFHAKITPKESLVAIHVEPTSFLKPLIIYDYFKSIIENFEVNDLVSTLSARFADKRDMLLGTHPEIIPTYFLKPLARLFDLTQIMFQNASDSDLYANIISRNTMKQIGQIIDSSFLFPIITAPYQFIMNYAADNDFVTWLTAKLTPKESLIAIHIEPTSFLRPITVYNYFKSIIASSEMNEFVSNFVAKINSVEKPLVAIHPELIPVFRQLIKKLPGKIRGLFVRMDFINPKDPYQGDFDVDL